MPHTCCVPNCNSGYRSCTDKNYAMFRFPKDSDMKQKWLRAIPRENWTISATTRVCSKHFEQNDFKDTSTDKRVKRRQARATAQLRRLALKPMAIPHIFPGLPTHYNIKAPLSRTTAASSSLRREKENERIQRQYDEFRAQDIIECFGTLKEKLKCLSLPDDCCFVEKANYIVFHCFDYNSVSSAPNLLVSVVVSQDLSVAAYTQSLKINQNHFEHLLNHGHVSSATSLTNILAHCKALCNAGSNDHMRFKLELAISSLQESLSILTDTSDQSKDDLIKFMIEQLQLMQLPKQAIRYSTATITTAFLWQLTSCSLYKKLRELFILPSVSRLRSYSGCLSVEAGYLDMSYLKQRTELLEENEKIVTLMIDEVYTAKRIEYSHGTFVGLNNDGEPAKTVLAFMVQSACSKFKDVVCLVPVHKLDSTQLRYWFDKVMAALSDIFCVIAVSVDNHVCNRKMFVELCGGTLQPYISHPTRHGELLFLIFDFTHNFKNIFNNFLAKGRMHIPTSGFELILGSHCLGLFSHIKQLYHLEEHKTLKVAHALKKVSLNPSNVSKTSPQHAICVFSESTARALSYYSTDHPHFAGTGNFVTFINNLWKVMSLKSPSKGFRKNDELCTPLMVNADGSYNCTMTFLEKALAILEQWKASGQSGLTSETFTACIQSVKAMMALASHLISKHGFTYVLPGKFTSDPIEGRFGWYRQVNGGNFYMSILQLFQAEKKIRCLSLLQQKSLHLFANLKKHSISSMEWDERTEDFSWLKDWVVQIQVNEVSGDDAAVTYYVAGYIGRCVSRRRKCTSCKNLLIGCENISCLSEVTDAKNLLIAIADRGGLSIPMQYCFAICALGVQVYSELSRNESIWQNFLTVKNQRLAFVAALTDLAKENADHTFLLQQTCEDGHANFGPILHSLLTALPRTN